MSQRVVVFGNSGAGKTTLARTLAERDGLGHLDLDTLAWRDTAPPTRRPLEESIADMQAFLERHEHWVIEGCYADLLTCALAHATQALWLNPPTETCIAHARSRPWEPHKYPSKAAQDANLPMLLDWIRAYDTRDDEFSRASHARLFAAFEGLKEEITAPPDT